MNNKNVNHITCGIILFVLSLLISPVGTGDNGVSASALYPPVTNHVAGAKQMTPEKWKIFHKTHARISNVHLNQLGLKRINKERNKYNLQPMDASSVKAVGAEIDAAIEPDIDAKGPAPLSSPGSQALANAASLPGAVDNSAEPWFPVIGDQGQEGSCVAFATTYYQLTFQYAAMKGWTVGSDLTKIFSPKWTYNMANGGGDYGTYNDDIYQIMETNGAATWAQFPYKAGDYLAWDLVTNDWQNALPARINPVQYVYQASSSSGVSLIKQLLANGYILTFDTAVYSWQFTTIKQDPTSATVTPYLGQQVAYWVNGWSGGHSMTIVGYDDSIWVDINGNGKVDPGERGAFKIANSWGRNYGNAGFWWLAYDALNNVSAVSGGPSASRVGAFMYGNDEVFQISAKPNYTPKMIAQFTVNTQFRSQLTMFLGTSATTAKSPSLTWYPNALNASAGLGGGAYAFNGSTTAVPGTFVLDFTDILPSTNVTQNYYLGMTNSDTTNKAPSTLSAYQLVDLTTNTTVSQSPLLLPVNAEKQTVYSMIPYTFNGNSALIASAVATPASGVAPLTVTFDASLSSDSKGTITSYTWNFGDGAAGSGKTISHIFTSSGTFNAKLTVTDNQGATATFTIPITVIQLVAPTGLTATPGNAQVALSWNASTGATSYNVKRSTVSGGPYTTVAATTATTFIDNKSVVNGTTYYYVVSAVSSSQESANSSQVSATPTLPVPPPTGLQGAPGNNQVTLSWKASAGAASYNVKKSTTYSGPFTILASGVKSTTLVDTAVKNGLIYCYVVSAVNANGVESVNSNEIEVVPLAPLPPPVGLTATAGPGSVSLSWTAVPGEEYYYVLRSTVNGGPFYTTASPASNYYKDTNVSAGVTYYYEVEYYSMVQTQSGSVVGEMSLPSAQVSARPLGSLPTAPVIISVMPGNNQVALSWYAVSTATSYNVKRATAVAGPFTTLINQAQTAFTDTTAKNGTTYYYAVSALNASGEGPISGLYMAVPFALPNPPTGLTAISTKSGVVLSWTAVPGALWYYIAKSTNSGGPYSIWASSTTNGVTDKTVLTSGTTYYYVVSTYINVNGVGKVSSYSAPVGVKVS